MTLKKPNFLFIMTDQQRADHLGCYGNKILKTPNIDNIAKNGVTFDEFYVANSTCMPNRASLITGRMPSVNGVLTNGQNLPIQSNTFVHLLRQGGYRTALFGKCHLQNGYTHEIDSSNSIIFNSLYKIEDKKGNLWQHFCGIEIETDQDFFDDEILNLMDFACDQRNRVHFFYTLPFTKRKALVETTWISELNNDKLKDYDQQIDDYLSNHLNIRNCKVNYKELGAIPLFRTKKIKKPKEIYIGSAGGMTRLSTGYTFLNIQEHSKYIRENIEKIEDTRLFQIEKKYEFLDKIFLKVLKNNSSQMGQIFYKLFNNSPKSVINFLSNKSNFKEDLEIISKMPKWIFLKELF